MGVKQQQINIGKKKKRKDNEISRLLSKDKTLRAAGLYIGMITDVGSHTPSSEHTSFVQRAPVPCSSCLHCTER